MGLLSLLHFVYFPFFVFTVPLLLFQFHFIFSFLFLSFLSQLLPLSLSNRSQSSVLNLSSLPLSLPLSDLPVCFPLSVSPGSGHVNRINPFHAQSNPMIIDPWGCVCVCSCVCVQGSEGSVVLEDIRPVV